MTHPLATLIQAHAEQHRVSYAAAKTAVLATPEGAAAAKGTTDDPSPKARLRRLVTMHMDTHGVGKGDATRAVLATREGAELDAQIPKPPPGPTVDQRIRDSLTAKWAEHAPGEPVPEFKLRISTTPDFVIAYVDGMPGRLLGVALHGKPPIVIVKEGLLGPTRRRVLLHEIAHIIFDGRDADPYDVKETRADRFAGLLRVELAPLDPITGRPMNPY